MVKAGLLWPRRSLTTFGDGVVGVERGGQAVVVELGGRARAVVAGADHEHPAGQVGAQVGHQRGDRVAGPVAHAPADTNGSVQAVSTHIKVLADAGLVIQRKEGSGARATWRRRSSIS